MFSIRPELFLCLPLYTTILDHEAAGVANAAVFSAYKGYGTTFRYDGGARGGTSHALNAASRIAHPPKRNIPFVVVIDAHVNRGSQFGPAMNTRDLNKAFIGFDLAASTADVSVIATGPWGCGAFGGDVGLKFAQQLLAAAMVTSGDASMLVASVNRPPPQPRPPHDDGGDHAAAEELDRMRPRVSLRYHDATLGRVFAAYTGLMARLRVSVAQLNAWICTYSPHRVGYAATPAGWDATPVGAASAKTTSELQALCASWRESAGSSSWPPLQGEEATELPPHSEAWYWSAVAECEAKGLIGPSTFLAWLGFKLGQLLRDTAAKRQKEQQQPARSGLSSAAQQQQQVQASGRSSARTVTDV